MLTVGSENEEKRRRRRRATKKKKFEFCLHEKYFEWFQLNESHLNTHTHIRIFESIIFFFNFQLKQWRGKWQKYKTESAIWLNLLKIVKIDTVSLTVDHKEMVTMSLHQKYRFKSPHSLRLNWQSNKIFSTHTGTDTTTSLKQKSNTSVSFCSCVSSELDMQKHLSVK